MSDAKYRALVRRFEEGDVDAGAPLASAMMRAQSLLYAVAALTPALQEALAARTMVNSLREEVSRALAEGISIEDVVSEIDYNRVAYEIDISDVAANVNVSDLAEQIAGEFSAYEIAEHVSVDYDELAEVVAGRIAESIDMDELADMVAERMSK